MFGTFFFYNLEKKSFCNNCLKTTKNESTSNRINIRSSTTEYMIDELYCCVSKLYTSSGVYFTVHIHSQT